ncbi:hypothetical protein CC86DRAFT_401520 [Ophiobolus disseminans]|uniref:Uncharacterized protein n=1 Tax=Ophiobolus disseminans TaxID=1469910 RepID=A0A6A7AEE2_9PLEO|nr:hypothetical protein CC86DRAFT_401520 [Ophiobolus disseminans]
MSESIEGQLDRVSLEATTPSQQTSPLLRLPGELRNKIYEYALCDQTWKPGKNIPLCAPSPLKYEFDGLYSATAFSNCCRQIRADTHLWAFSKSTFQKQDSLIFASLVDELATHQRDAITRVEMMGSLKFSARLCNVGRYRFSHEVNIDGLDVVRDLKGLRHILLNVEVTMCSRQARDDGAQPDAEDVQRVMRTLEQMMPETAELRLNFFMRTK